MHAFGCHGKHYFPENDFRLTTNFPFDHGNPFLPSFSLQFTSRKREREREKREPRSERERDDRTARTSGAVHDHDRRSSGAIDAIAPNRDRDRRRDLAKRRLRSRDGETATLIAILPSRDRDFFGLWLVFLRRDRDFSGLWLVFFWVCVFLLLFQTPENIFRKIF